MGLTVQTSMYIDRGTPNLWFGGWGVVGAV